MSMSEPSGAVEGALRAALKQQRAVAEFGQDALRGMPVDEMCERAVDLLAALLEVEVTGILEYQPRDNCLVLRWGRGWPDSAIGTRMPTDPGNQVGAILASGEPLLVTDVRTERRVQFSPTVLELGIRSSIGVRILGPRGPLGVIGALSTRPRTFTPDDASFLQAIANVLGAAWALDETSRQRHAAQAALARSAERERAQIATDLHDDVVQVMAATLISLDRLLRRMRNLGRADLTDQAQAARDTLGLAIDRTRHLMFQLRPPALDGAGLRGAVVELARGLEQDDGISVQVDVGDGAIPDEVETLAYRTVAELVSNVRRHAAASSVDLSIGTTNATLSGSVADDGRGFDVPAALDRSRRPLHLGLDAAAERLRLAGGTIDIASRPGLGTTVTFSIPLDGV